MRWAGQEGLCAGYDAMHVVPALLSGRGRATRAGTRAGVCAEKFSQDNIWPRVGHHNVPAEDCAARGRVRNSGGCFRRNRFHRASVFYFQPDKFAIAHGGLFL